MADETPTYSIIMVVHNALPMVQMATLRTLQHSAGQSARLVVVDNASHDGAEIWLDLLAQRGDIQLIRCQRNIGHGPGLELARAQTTSPLLVTLDSDAFPLSDQWLTQLQARLNDRVKVVGIRHHRDYIHPACLLIARQTLDELKLTFLNEKERPSRFDVGERISAEVKRHGYQIAGLERTSALRRGSLAEPVYLGSEYEGVVYHQWYTTRAGNAGNRPVDDVPREAIAQSLREVIEAWHNQMRAVTVIVGVRAQPQEPQRLRNALACLWCLNRQDLARWRYRIVVVEQDDEPRHASQLTPLADHYIFAYNPGPYNRGWAFNIGAVLTSDATEALCLIDADLLVPSDFLSRGIAAMQGGVGAIQPYNAINYLDETTSARVIAEQRVNPTARFPQRQLPGRLSTTSQGGCIWVEPRLYRQIGGHDERLRGWGYEDREFWQRLAQATTIQRLPGRLLHLEHPQSELSSQWAATNRRLAAQPHPAGAIGDRNLYAHERPGLAQTQADKRFGERSWEQWYRWSPQRIEGIVQREQNLDPDQSARRKLAQLLVTLGHSLLDLGCGPGALWPHLAAYRPQFTWVGADATAKMVETARRLFPHVPVYHVDAANTSFADKSFDIVLLRHVLEYMPEWLMTATLVEAIRLARRAVVVDFYVAPAPQALRQTTQVGTGFYETRWTVAELAVPITRAGWVIDKRLSIRGIPDEHDEVWILSPGAQIAQPDSTEQHTVGQEPFKFSIIMPTYRRSHTIQRTVGSILAQTYQNWELIIVNNGEQETYRFDDPRIKVYQHADRHSASYARNQGLRYATGDLLCFFDDDDDMFPNYLALFAATFQANPSVNMVRCGMIVSNGRIDYSYATPECCLRRAFATSTWENRGRGQDQRYFQSIIAAQGWSEAQGDIVVIREALCRANADRRGGLRSGQL